jgi:hypothetical protein
MAKEELPLALREPDLSNLRIIPPKKRRHGPIHWIMRRDGEYFTVRNPVDVYQRRTGIWKRGAIAGIRKDGMVKIDWEKNDICAGNISVVHVDWIELSNYIRPKFDEA